MAPDDTNQKALPTSLADDLAQLAHRTDCEHRRLCGDPAERVSSNEPMRPGTPWQCFCGRDRAIEYLRALARVPCPTRNHDGPCGLPAGHRGAHEIPRVPPASEETTALRDDLRMALQEADGAECFQLAHQACDLITLRKAVKVEGDWYKTCDCGEWSSKVGSDLILDDAPSEFARGWDDAWAAAFGLGTGAPAMMSHTEADVCRLTRERDEARHHLQVEQQGTAENMHGLEVENVRLRTALGAYEVDHRDGAAVPCGCDVCLQARAALAGTGDVLSHEERANVGAFRALPTRPLDRIVVAILDRLAPPCDTPKGAQGG